MVADVLGPPKLAKKSKARYILAISELFTKYTIKVASHDLTAVRVAHAIKGEWIMNF